MLHYLLQQPVQWLTLNQAKSGHVARMFGFCFLLALGPGDNSGVFNGKQFLLSRWLFKKTATCFHRVKLAIVAWVIRPGGSQVSGLRQIRWLACLSRFASISGGHNITVSIRHITGGEVGNLAGELVAHGHGYDIGVIALHIVDQAFRLFIF